MTDDDIRRVWNRTQDPIATVRAFVGGELPPLPKQTVLDYKSAGGFPPVAVKGYTADQMREYALAARASSMGAPEAGTERAKMVAACAHSWRDFGQLGGRNVSWCGKCDVLAFTGDEDVFSAAPVSSPPITATHKMVPVEITEEMHAAAVRTIVRCTGNADFPPRVWRAMLAAAPAVPLAAPLTDNDIARLNEWADRRAALSAPLTAEQDAKDAARYRWLRKQKTFWHPLGVVADGERLDAGIDAALSAGGEQDGRA